MGRRVLITGISNQLGSSLASALIDTDDIDLIAGVGSSEPPPGLDGIEFINADIRSPLIHRVLSSIRADTVVHADLTSAPIEVGGRSAQKEQNVIGTMQLMAACQRSTDVRKVIVRSSVAVYGWEPGDPSIYTEDWSSKSTPAGYAKDVGEAETYARDFGRRRQDVTLSILRLANILGPHSESNMTQLFSLPLVPTAAGFDPRLQFLHEDDAVEVLRQAVTNDHPGVYNVAASGVLYLSQALRRARRFGIPVIAQFGELVADLLRRSGVVDFPMDQLNLLVHGRVVDTTRLRKEFGFEPKFTTQGAFDDYLRTRGAPSGPDPLIRLEREIYDQLLQLTSTTKPSSQPAPQ